MEHIKRFLKQEYNLADIPLSELNYEFVTTLDKYFRLDRKCNHNTTAKYIKNLKKIINLAIKLNWLDKDPFLHYQIKTKPVERGFLTQQELDRIINYRFSTQRLELVADLFIFSCYTGLAYIDIKKLPQDAIVTGIDACQWLSVQRQKTGTTSNIPLLPPALRIIEKYKDHPLSSSSGKLLPVLSNQKLNSYLKEIADLCNINKNLTFHLARHTFATSVTLANGISMEAVSKMLGHQSVRTTQIYSKIVESQISNEMQKLRAHFTHEKEDLKKSNQ
jgi:site-specific recombinase XerD